MAGRDWDLLTILEGARQLVDHAERLGVRQSILDQSPPPYGHIGAALADAILQAGLNYNTVVRPRVERIVNEYPYTADLPPLAELVSAGQSATYLSWLDKTKIHRFDRLVTRLDQEQISTVRDLNSWLTTPKAKESLLEINGIGPKTFDYICLLVGIDRIAVDRHVRTFICQAGVVADTYDEMQMVASFAADLLGLRRRSFDAWIWATFNPSSCRRDNQLSLI